MFPALRRNLLLIDLDHSVTYQVLRPDKPGGPHHHAFGHVMDGVMIAVLHDPTGLLLTHYAAALCFVFGSALTASR